MTSERNCGKLTVELRLRGTEDPRKEDASFIRLPSAAWVAGVPAMLGEVDWCGPVNRLRRDCKDEAVWSMGDLFLGGCCRDGDAGSDGAVEYAESGGEL
jgi:hypothetical protein